MRYRDAINSRNGAAYWPKFPGLSGIVNSYKEEMLLFFAFLPFVTIRLVLRQREQTALSRDIMSNRSVQKGYIELFKIDTKIFKATIARYYLPL